MEHTQLIDAVNIRTAVRAYDNEPIDDDTARQLSMTLDAINTLAGTHMQLVLNQPKVFAAANESGHLTNAANYIALVEPNNDLEARERAGFYAERAVLTATLRGLGTLWVGGSWDRDEAARHCRIGRDKELYLCVVVGYPEHHLSYQAKSYDELVEFQRSHRPTKTFAQFTAEMSDAERAAAPDWFTAGVEAAMKAPSAMNKQPVTFTYDAVTDTAIARLDPRETYRETLNDLGIAKLHFQIGAGAGEWTWGDGGRFTHK